MWLRKGHEAAIMDEIKDIYNRELYQPFVEYCAAHGYRTMRDLGCYDFRDRKSVV